MIEPFTPEQEAHLRELRLECLKLAEHAAQQGDPDEATLARARAYGAFVIGSEAAN